MAAPDFINDTICPWYYHNSTGITDVNTIITDLRTALVTNLSWTEPSTALFQSPVDSAGRFMDILVTRIAATNVEFRLRDFRSATLCTKRIQIDATASVNYFAGKYYCYVESLRATIEIFQANILEQTPDTAASLGNYLLGNGYRNNADTPTNGDTVGQHFAFDNGTGTIVGSRMRGTSNSAGTAAAALTTPGTLLYEEATFWVQQASANRYSGRLYQQFLCDSSIAFAADKVIPVDDAGTTATFRVIGLNTNVNRRTIIRKA